MIEFETAVRINEPPERVFGYLADPKTYPRWNTTVVSVEPFDSDGRYEMHRELADGPVRNILEITEFTPPEEIVIEANDGPTPFVYRFHLASRNGGTELGLRAAVDPAGVPRLFTLVPPSLAARTLKSGIARNLRTLKALVERT